MKTKAGTKLVGLDSERAGLAPGPCLPINGDAARKDGRLKRSIHIEPQPHTGLACLTQLVAGLRKTQLAGVESRRRLPIVSPINPHAVTN